jgi:hypothetical protein
MRRPAQHSARAGHAGWAHPYPTGVFSPVFYNDGGDPQPPAQPSPADVAAQAQKNPPAVEPLRDENGVIITQERFGQNMAKERRAGRHAAIREIAEAAGIQDFNLDTFDPSAFGKMFKQADEARKAKLSEDERRAEALAQQENDLAARVTQAEQREAAAAQRERDTKVRAVLVSLGATGADLDDAAALIRVTDDASDDDITTAAEELKGRRAEMFGGAQSPAPGAVPPAPSGMPGTGIPRPGANQPKPGERGLAMLKRRGKIAADA